MEGLVAYSDDDSSGGSGDERQMKEKGGLVVLHQGDLASPSSSTNALLSAYANPENHHDENLERNVDTDEEQHRGRDGRPNADMNDAEVPSSNASGEGICSPTAMPFSPPFSPAVHKGGGFGYVPTEMSLQLRHLATSNLQTTTESKPPAALVKKINYFTEVRNRRGMYFNDRLRSSHDFRNPDMMANHIKFYNIEETATHYPPTLFNPSDLNLEEESYEALSSHAYQRMEKARLEKQGRGRVDFISSGSSRPSAIPLHPATMAMTSGLSSVSAPSLLSSSTSSTNTTMSDSDGDNSNKPVVEVIRSSDHKKKKSKWDVVEQKK